MFDDSDDEFEEEYVESNRILADFDKTKSSSEPGTDITETETFKQALADAIDLVKEQIIQTETDRIYKEAKDNYEQSAKDNQAKVTTINVKSRNAKGRPGDEFIVQYNASEDEFVEEEEMLLDSIEPNDEDANEDSHMIFVEEQEEQFEPKFVPVKETKSYMVLESGDVALSEDIDYYEGDMSLDEDNQSAGKKN